MKTNAGSDYLIPRDEWVEAEDIQGDEMKVMKSPVIRKAFEKICNEYRPKHKTCIVSLCTTSRPYSKSQKWKVFEKEFGEAADLIVCSNGGIIPQKYWNCYPYLTYDAHAQSKYNKYYINYCYRNMLEFFEKHHYDRIILNFRPNMRNRIAALAFQRDFKGSSEVVIVPTVKAYRKAQKSGFPRGKMFPDLDPNVLAEIKEAVFR